MTYKHVAKTARSVQHFHPSISGVCFVVYHCIPYFNRTISPTSNIWKFENESRSIPPGRDAISGCYSRFLENYPKCISLYS